MLTFREFVEAIQENNDNLKESFESAEAWLRYNQGRNRLEVSIEDNTKGLYAVEVEERGREMKSIVDKKFLNNFIKSGLAQNDEKIETEFSSKGKEATVYIEGESFKSVQITVDKSKFTKAVKKILSNS